MLIGWPIAGRPTKTTSASRSSSIVPSTVRSGRAPSRQLAVEGDVHGDRPVLDRRVDADNAPLHESVPRVDGGLLALDRRPWPGSPGCGSRPSACRAARRAPGSCPAVTRWPTSTGTCCSTPSMPARRCSASTCERRSRAAARCCSTSACWTLIWASIASPAIASRCSSIFSRCSSSSAALSEILSVMSAISPFLCSSASASARRRACRDSAATRAAAAFWSSSWLWRRTLSSM